MIKVDNLFFSYKNMDVLHGVNFVIKRGEFKFLLGENGAGKSTLIRCLLGLLKYEEGDILLNGKSIKCESAKQRSRIFSYVPQAHNPTFNYKVLDIVLMARAGYYAFYESPKKADIERAENILCEFGMQDIMNRGYAEISGGQRQIVLIARALNQDSKIIVMDEPTSGLDYGNHLNLLNILQKLKNKGKTIFLSSHIPQDALDFGDSVLLLKKGKVLMDAPINEAITSKTMKSLYGVDIDIMEIDGKKVCYRRGKKC